MRLVSSSARLWCRRGLFVLAAFVLLFLSYPKITAAQTFPIVAKYVESTQLKIDWDGVNNAGCEHAVACDPNDPLSYVLDVNTSEQRDVLAFADTGYNIGIINWSNPLEVGHTYRVQMHGAGDTYRVSQDFVYIPSAPTDVPDGAAVVNQLNIASNTNPVLSTFVPALPAVDNNCLLNGANDLSVDVYVDGALRQTVTGNCTYGSTAPDALNFYTNNLFGSGSYYFVVHSLSTGNIWTSNGVGYTVPPFSVSNLAFNHATGRYSFDYSGYHGGDITGESVAIHAEGESWGYNHEPATCTGGTSGTGSCSGTFNHSQGAFSCFNTVYVQIYGYNPSDVVHSLDNPDPSCGPAAPNPLFPDATHATIDHLGPNSANELQADLTLPGYSQDCWNDLGFTATVYNAATNQPVVTMVNSTTRHLCGFLDSLNHSHTWTVYPDFVLPSGVYWIYAHSNNNGNGSWVTNSLNYVAPTPPPVHNSFTASNIVYNPVAQTLSFDVANFYPDTDSINPTNMIGILDLDANWSAYNNTLTTTCSNFTHCSATIPQTDNGFSFPSNHHYALGLIQFNNHGNTEYHSQDLPYATLFPTPAPNQAPAVSFAADSSTINEGDTFTAHGSFTDPDSTAWTATVDYGDGSGVQPLTLNPDKTFSLSHLYVDNGSYTITVAVTDNGNLTGTSNGSGGGVVVNNPAPTVPPITPPSNVGQNSPAVINVNFTDYGNQSHTATINWGDGSGNQSVPVSGNDFSSGHNYQNPGTYTVTVIIVDSQGATTTQTLTITVLNVAPSVGTINFPSSVAVGSSVPLSVNFTDPGTADTHTATINWGDSHTTNGTVSESNGSGSVAGSHTYASPGAYTVTVTVTDNGGGVGHSTASTTAINQLSALSPAGVWIGLKNSDDVGTKFDLKVEAYKGSTLVASGQLDSFAGGSSGFNNAHLATIPFGSFSAIDFPAGSVLNVTVSVRNACVGSGHNSGVARLWYNDSAANSKFGVSLGGSNATYYLRDAFALATTAGPGPQKTVDVQAGAKCSAFKPFATWSATL